MSLPVGYLQALLILKINTIVQSSPYPKENSFLGLTTAKK